MAHRTQKFKWMVVAVACICFTGVIWAFFQYRRSSGGLQIPLPPKTATQAIMALSKVHQTATKDGRTQWELDAKAAELESGSGKMVLQAPKVKFFLEDGTQVILTAREGILYTTTNDMEVRGKVNIRNDQYTLTTETLTYAHDHRVLQADSAVRIVGESVELKAATMRYDLNTNQTQFEGLVEGILHEYPAL